MEGIGALEKSIVPVTGKREPAKIVDDECKVEVPEGWRRQVVQRQGGLSAGKFDVYYYSPLGKKLRSKKEVQNHCEQNNIDVNIDLIRFTRVSLTGGEKKRKRKSLPGLLLSESKPPKLPKTKANNAQKKLGTGIKRKIKPKIEKSKSPFLLSSEGLIKKKIASLWVPPKSPFNLFQESLFKNPWKLLIGTLFLNKGIGNESLGHTLLSEFFKRWSSPESAMKADWKDLAELLKRLPNSERLSKMIIKFSEEYLTKDWTYPKELHGIGKYGNDSYRIFCINEWKKVKPTDYLLTFYVDWLWDNYTILGVD